MRSVRPIAEAALGRPQEQGKIKLGKKVATKSGGASRPTSIETFRFVSRDEQAIRTLAERLGGTPQLVDGQWDLESESKEIDVILPPDPLGGTPIYELWSGGGCQRRCDGVTATVPVATGDDVSFVDQACICASNERMECKPTVRLSVILPYVTLGGVWNLKTNSWAATREMQQMVATIEMAQTRGLVAAVLALEARQQKTAGKTRNFVVPVLRLNATLAELAAGGNNAMALSAPAQAALPAGSTEPTDEERMALNRAWKNAGEDDRAAVMIWLEHQDLTMDSISAAHVAEIMELLTAEAQMGEVVES